MMLDRRRRDRAGLTRRTTERTACWKRICWRIDGDERSRAGLLVSASESGLAMLTDQPDSPQVGAHISLGPRSRPWARSARIIRVEPVSTTTSRVAAEFTAPPPT